MKLVTTTNGKQATSADSAKTRAARAVISAAALCIVAAALYPLSAGAQDITWETVASDDFTISDEGPRHPGAPLHLAPAQTGGLTWQASDLPVFASGQLSKQAKELMPGLLSNAGLTNTTVRASIPFDGGAQLPARVFRISVRVDMDGFPSPTNSWAAVGFFDRARRPVWDGGELWLLIRPDGRIKVACPTGDLYFRPTPDPAFVAGVNHIMLQYDSVSGDVTAKVNGTLLPLDHPNVHTFGYTPSVLHAGLNAYSSTQWTTAGVLGMDDFLLEKGTPVMDPALSATIVPELGYHLIGDQVVFHCDADGAYQPLEYQWQYLLQRFPGGPVTYHSVEDGSGVSGSQTPNLVFDPVAQDHARTYRCLITDAAPTPNTLGSAAFEFNPREALLFDSFETYGSRTVGSLLNDSPVQAGTHPDLANITWAGTLALGVRRRSLRQPHGQPGRHGGLWLPSGHQS